MDEYNLKNLSAHFYNAHIKKAIASVKSLISSLKSKHQIPDSHSEHQCRDAWRRYGVYKSPKQKRLHKSSYLN